jgi:catechol 2,3-dioxygenase-like lactoylglutathione lyase family enzyme
MRGPRKIAFVTYPAVKDIEKTKRFYTLLLGIEGVSHSGQDSDGPWTWVEYDLPEGGCFAISNMRCAIPSVGSNVAFEVDDVDDILKSLPSEVIKERPFDTGVCRMAVIYDPEGNTVILHKIKQKQGG